MAVPVVNVYRRDTIESVHHGNLAVVNSDGKLLYSVGDPNLLTFMRSTAKPLQAIAVVESGAFRKFGFSTEQLAVMCASHSGEQKHIEAVAEILKRIGLGPEHLKCGVHIPLHYTTNDIAPPADLKLSPLGHNCSGKHAGMLALCVFYDYPIDNYLDFDHPIQQLIIENISSLCKYPKEKIKVAVDGCSVPVHGVPLYNMAYAYARFVTPNSVPAEKARVYSTIYRAMMEHPEMVGGTNRYDTALMNACHGKLIAKVGAEGIHCVGVVDKGLAMAAKVSDGTRRAIFPFSLEALRQLGVVIDEQMAELKGFHTFTLRNYRNIEIGYLKPEFELLATP